LYLEHQHLNGLILGQKCFEENLCNITSHKLVFKKDDLKDVLIERYNHITEKDKFKEYLNDNI